MAQGLLLRAGMMASRLHHLRHVIPALTDHMAGEGEVIGPAKIHRFCGN
jgi:hypothetical protein